MRCIISFFAHNHKLASDPFLSWSTEGSEATLYDTVIVDACHCTFVKPIEGTTPSMNPIVY
jgi:hypothetical protein